MDPRQHLNILFDSISNNELTVDWGDVLHWLRHMLLDYQIAETSMQPGCDFEEVLSQIYDYKDEKKWALAWVVKLLEATENKENN